jgi:hypothetical protein
VPKALIPSNTPHKISEFGQHYWKLSDPIHLLAARGVNKEFDTVITKAFYSMNTFELHDRTASLRAVGAGRNFMDGEHARIVAHRWLELQSKLGNMAHIRNLNIDISIDPFNGQYKWHVRRTFLAIAAIPDLRRLVITTNMYGFISDGPGPEYQDWDYHFWRDDTTPYPLEWCGVRMVSWAASKKKKLYLPQYRAVEHVFKELTEMKDGDPYKCWIEDDWEEPINGFATPEIANGVAVAKARDRNLGQIPASDSYLLLIYLLSYLECLKISPTYFPPFRDLEIFYLCLPARRINATSMIEPIRITESI